jgi:flavin reductase (DIM6/NTAB) family NADH-FMN oxidoreductase RutF
MRNFATGVAVATTYADRGHGREHDAVTINSLTSVSLDPPRVSLCLRHESKFLADLLESKVWAVSILDGASRSVAARFARDRASRAVSLGGLQAEPGARTGALVIEAPTWLECVLHSSYEIGDHTMVVGDVVASGARAGGTRLIFLYGSYHALEDPNNGEFT